MKFVKSQYRVSLTNEDLRKLIYTALTSYRPDFQKLAKKVETHSNFNAGKCRKSCKSCNCICSYYLIKTCFVYFICINTSKRICGSPAVLN